MLAGPCNSPQLRALSYYIVLLPPVYICMNYALNVQPIANNIYSVFFRQDTEKKTKKRSKRCIQLLKVLIRLFVAVIPLAVGFGVSNLVTVLQYAGLTGFLLSFIFPTALQLQSIRVCKRVFRGVCTAKTTFTFPAVDSTEKGTKDSMKVGTGAGVVCSQQDKKSRSESSFYMTPYSTRVLSHPIAVTIIGAIGILIFILTIVSLFFKPEKLPTCKTLEI